jgi:type VI secretion system protein ImpE
MTAEELLKNGDVKQALTELFAQVRAQPSDAKLRIFLFQLLCVAGQWDRALTQLNVAHELDPAAGIMGKAYQEILHCEAIRRSVFDGTRTPLVFGDPPPWLAQLLEALRLEGKGQQDSANELRLKAFDEAPAIAGTIQTASRSGLPGSDPEIVETTFEWLADGDSRLGPVIEFIINGRYYWAPQQHIAEIIVEAPTDLRDLVWVPAHFRWVNAGEAVGVIPTRYVGSEASEDGAVQLARKTEWKEVAEGVYEGQGQRTLMTDLGDYSLLDVRQITFTPS